MPITTGEITPVQRRKRPEELIYTKDELAYCLSRFYDQLNAQIALQKANSFFSAFPSFALSGLISYICCEFVDKWGVAARKIEAIYLLIHAIVLVIGILALVIIFTVRKSKCWQEKSAMIANYIAQEWDVREIESSPVASTGTPMPK